MPSVRETLPAVTLPKPKIVLNPYRWWTKPKPSELGKQFRHEAIRGVAFLAVVPTSLYGAWYLLSQISAIDHVLFIGVIGPITGFFAWATRAIVLHNVKVSHKLGGTANMWYGAFWGTLFAAISLTSAFTGIWGYAFYEPPPGCNGYDYLVTFSGNGAESSTITPTEVLEDRCVIHG